MPEQRYTQGHIERAEQLIARVRGISSCRISSDESGVITEIHVVSTSGKSPKLVARDVESALKAELGMAVDYKKIGVVMFDPDTGTADANKDNAAAGAELPEFPVEEYAARFTFRSVNLFISPDSVQAEVELERNGIESLGSVRSDNPKGPFMTVIAEATLKAVSELLDGKMRLCLSDVAEIVLGDVPAVVVMVSLVKGRDHKDLAGCSLYSGDANQTIVFATLDAVNRVVGVLKQKRTIEYKIK